MGSSTPSGKEAIAHGRHGRTVRVMSRENSTSRNEKDKLDNTQRCIEEWQTTRPSQDAGLKDYQLGDCLGKGAFGSVFRALNMGTGETVAVKQVKLADLPKSDLRVMTLEIDLLKNLDHPNIVKYRGFVKSTESLNIILEYCENGSLHSISKSFGKFPENLVGIYMSQVLHGLLYLHEQGVIHRDIKGANILTTKHGLVKLADFGVATRTTSFSESSVVGTPYWMAPEVIELSGATTASDIWSLGCTVIELLNGKPPYHKLQPMHALFRIVNDDHPPLPEGASPVVRDFLIQCFQKDPNLRVSARKLLRHPWIVNAKRSDAIVPKKPTQYDEAVKSVQEWNEALKSPHAGSLRKSSRPLSSSPIPGRRDALHVTAGPFRGSMSFGQSRVSTEQFRSPSSAADDVWDDDFDEAISPTALQLTRLKSQDQFAGLLSSERLKSFATIGTVAEETSWDMNFEGDLTVKSPLQFTYSDPSKTIRAARPIHEEQSAKGPSPLKASEAPEAGIAALDGHQHVASPVTPVTGYISNQKFPERKENNGETFTSMFLNGVDMKVQPSASKTSMMLRQPFQTQSSFRSMQSPKLGGSLRRLPVNLRQPLMRRTRSSMEIQRYAEDEGDEDFSDVFGKVSVSHGQADGEKEQAEATFMLTSKLSNNSWLGDEDDDDDPFALLEENFDEMDLNANVARDRYARLCTQVEGLVGSLKISQADNMLADISEQLLEILSDLPDTRDVIMSAHGMLPMLEILETCGDRDITFNLLRIINTIILDDVEIQENLCFVGGIPIITKYASKKQSSEIRLEAAAFIRQMFQTSILTLQMFVSAGGLKVLVEFLEEDYEEERELVLTGVNGIWSVFELQGPTPKNDFCRILSRNSVLDPLSLVLSRVLDEEGELADLCEGRIANIFFLFSQAESHVKELIAERPVLYRVLKELRRMAPNHQITMLKFIKNLSMLSTTLDALQNSNAIDVLTDLLRVGSQEAHYREISNQILNTIYNLCRLNKSRQEEAAGDGIIPVLQRIIKTKGPLKEFALPVLCDMASSGKVGRSQLWRNKGLSFYISLLSDEFWQVTALDAIFVWLQEETAKVEEHLLDSSFTSGIIKCFTTAKANAFENLLEPLQKLLRLSPSIALSLAHTDLFRRILQKFQSNKAVVRLNLLRIVRSICDASDDRDVLINRYGLQDSIQRLAENDGAVLVRNMAGELIKSSATNDKSSASATKRRPVRRSSSSMVSPNLHTSLSMPSTPTSLGSGHGVCNFTEGKTQQKNGSRGSSTYRPASGNGSGPSRLPTMVTPGGGAIKTPGIHSARPPKLQIEQTQGRVENTTSSNPRRDSIVVPIPNSRRRRRINGDLR